MCEALAKLRWYPGGYIRMNAETWFRGSLSERLRAIPDAVFSAVIFGVIIVVIGWVFHPLRAVNPALMIGVFFVIAALFNFAAPRSAIRFAPFRKAK